MIRRSQSASLRCESLEARDVPAIILNATVSGTDAVPDGGTIQITELQLENTTVIFNRDGTVAAGQTKSAIANDNMTFVQAGLSLTIVNNDGIFGGVGNVAGNPIVSYGTTLTIQNVAGLSVNLLLGGDDSVTDNTKFFSSISSGPGSDTLTASGAPLDPALFQFLVASSQLNAQVLSLVGATVPPKVLDGGFGNDTLTTTNVPLGFFLIGGAGDDTITSAALGVFNTLQGLDGNDTLIGGIFVDVLDAGFGTDVLFGLGGGDFYLATDGQFDFVLNQPGEGFFADPFDVVSFR